MLWAGLNNIALLSATIQLCKNQQEEIDDLRQKNKELEERMNDLEEIMTNLQPLVNLLVQSKK